MAKPQLVVLGFLSKKPMYGYQIGQIVEDMKLHIWAGIKLPSIYKALQTLESRKFIRGEQVTEGNNPPRTVFHLNPKGAKLLREMVLEELFNPLLLPQDWWMVLSFSQDAITKNELMNALDKRLDLVKSINKNEKHSKCMAMLENGELPFVMQHIFNLGNRHHKAEQLSLQELRDDITSGKHEDFFCSEGDLI